MYFTVGVIMGSDTIMKAIIVLSLLGLAYYLHVYVFGGDEGFRTLEVPAPAPQEFLPLPKRPIDTAAAGPSAPSAAPRATMPPSQNPEPKPADPYDDQVQAADAAEEMRYPERSFGPGKMPSDTSIAQASGIANKASMLTAQSAQYFSPEAVANGGMFFSEVAANEDENPGYTAF
jgi:hypothetical protein